MFCMRPKTRGDVTMDAVAIGSILAVIGTILVLVVLGIRVAKLIKNTHSKD